MGAQQRLRGQRARPHQRGGQGGLREGQPLTPQQHEQGGGSKDPLRASAVASQDGAFVAGLLALRPQLAYLDVVPDGPEERGGHWVPLDAPIRHPELTRRWVERYAQITTAQSGLAPPGMPSAFVLQHHLDPLAQVVATAAVRGDWVLDADPAHWAVRLEPTYAYPLAVRVTKGESLPVADPGERLARAEAGYGAAADAIATAFPAAHRMSSRQRLGMGRDMWRIALGRLRGGPPPDRESCCLLYALPGMRPCAGCPRG